MAEVKVKRCGTCGHRFDNRTDALVWCRYMRVHVIRDSVACSNWTDETYF